MVVESGRFWIPIQAWQILGNPGGSVAELTIGLTALVVVVAGVVVSDAVCGVVVVSDLMVGWVVVVVSISSLCKEAS